MQLQLWLIFTILFGESFISLKEKRSRLFKYVVGRTKEAAKTIFACFSHIMLIVLDRVLLKHTFIRKWVISGV